MAKISSHFFSEISTVSTKTSAQMCAAQSVSDRPGRRQFKYRYFHKKFLKTGAYHSGLEKRSILGRVLGIHASTRRQTFMFRSRSDSGERIDILQIKMIL
ncbi:hypothetical protein E6O75_ATG06472 [Venturia nashicola]|uniref:Uncharacterized protein n=1 Tax=Venturia nashicola TaxID=86259 RepID=A0A4Z1PAB1_9PEZI|nr:hypothetical protein E6O75_ATG06472 [Venturia nashicola]